MKICVLSPFDLLTDRGGAMVVRNLLSQWRESHSVSLVTSTAHPFHLDGVEVYYVSAPTYRDWQVQSLGLLRKVLTNEVVLDQAYSFALLRAVAFAKSPSTFLHSHGVPSIGIDGGLLGSAGFKTYATRLIAARSADSIIVASDLHRRALISTFGSSISSRLSLVWHGVNLSEFPESAPTGKRILFVGNLEQDDSVVRKGVPTLIAAFAKVYRESPEARLVMVGKTNERTRLDLGRFQGSEGLESLGHVKHTELAPIFQNCRLLVLPSFLDTYGQVVNEAMASGIPVVVSNRVGASEVVRRAGCGLVFRAGDSEGLSDCIRKLLGDDALAEKMGKNGRRFASAYLGWGTISEKYIKLFKSPLG